MVGHHQVDVASLKQLNTVVRRGCGNHPVALPFKNQFAKVQSWRFIINAKNCRPERVCGHPFLPGVQKLSQPEVKWVTPSVMSAGRSSPSKNYFPVLL